MIPAAGWGAARAALKAHWPEYLIEMAGLGAFMIAAGLCVMLVDAPPVASAVRNPDLRRALIGVAMGLTAIALIYSPCPPGRANPRWQERERLFLGINHTAIAASDTERSLAFSRDRLRLRIVGQSENWGQEQERLSGVPGVHARITTLRTANGPGIELLHYLASRDGHPTPPDTSPDDLWAEEIVLRGSGPPRDGPILRDPNGHAVRLVTAMEASP